jgi:hypothetical protein
MSRFGGIFWLSFCGLCSPGLGLGKKKKTVAWIPKESYGQEVQKSGVILHEAENGEDRIVSATVPVWLMAFSRTREKTHFRRALLQK